MSDALDCSRISKAMPTRLWQRTCGKARWIISSDPGELENLQARLASPETFARVGLEPPDSTVSGLQFTVALDPQGRPVIRVTSAEPINASLLTFLLEVDWGQGRLVREYSALLDAPETVAAPAQPPIQAPSAAP